MAKGLLMSRIQAAKKAGVDPSVINKYVAKGYLEPIVLEGYEFVYYRDVLKASWKATQDQSRNRW